MHRHPEAAEKSQRYRFTDTTTLNIDDAALEAAMKTARGQTKTAVINDALREYARRRRIRQLLDFRGRFRWEGDLDELRKRTPLAK